MHDVSLPTKDAEKSRADTPQFSTEDVLLGMLNASNDACWCIEFRQPVNLMAGAHQIVSQIFANGPVWRHCNAAMERLYHLPAGENMNTRPVHEIFPDNSSNRDFLLNLIANGFEVDGAPALDRRYDGLEIYVENDVRAHIAGGKLYRMFGTVRNVGKQRRLERALVDQMVALEAMITALPNPFIAVDAFEIIEAFNPATEARFGQIVAGQSFDALLAYMGVDQLQPEIAKVIARVRTLGIPMTFRFAKVMADTVWQIAPRETVLGTGFILQLLPGDVMEI